MSRLLLRVFSGFTLLVFLSVTTPASAAAQDQTDLPMEELVVSSSDGEHRFKVEVAATDQQRARGLMFREEMAGDHGMLFIFEGEGDRFFWMKNTPLPLDIIYIGASGKIVSIAANTTPYSHTVIPSGRPAKYVLELNAGTAAKLGIAAGDDVASPAMELD